MFLLHMFPCVKKATKKKSNRTKPHTRAHTHTQFLYNFSGKKWKGWDEAKQSGKTEFKAMSPNYSIYLSSICEVNPSCWQVRSEQTSGLWATSSRQALQTNINTAWTAASIFLQSKCSFLWTSVKSPRPRHQSINKMLRGTPKVY